MQGDGFTTDISTDAIESHEKSSSWSKDGCEKAREHFWEIEKGLCRVLLNRIELDCVSSGEKAHSLE